MRKTNGGRTPPATLSATILIGLIGALWEWRSAVKADPFHYSNAGAIASGFLFSLLVFAGFALAVWLLSRLLRRHTWAPALLVVSFLYLESLAQFAHRGGSVHSVVFVASFLLTTALAVPIALVIRRGTGRKTFVGLLVLLFLVGGVAITYDVGLLETGGGGSARKSSAIGRAPAPSGSPHLVLITIDTLRPDFLGAYGNPFVHTPNMDRFSREGTQAARALSSIPITLPSHATIMTGTHPATNGVMNNGYPFEGEEESVLAGHLRKHGYETAAFVGSFPLDAAFGLNRGFDVYDDETGDAALFSSLRFRKLLHESSAGAILKRFRRPVMTHRVSERRGEAVWDAARAWLDKRNGDPFFLWLHFYDPHAPYDPDPIDRKLYEGRSVLHGGNDLADVEIPQYARLHTANDIDTYRRLYAGEVTRVDRVIGEIEHYFDEREWTPRTFFALTSDHGEGLGSHDILSHTSRLYDEQLAVPLFLRGPGITRGGLSNAPFRLVDLAPTLLARAGLPALPGAEGRAIDTSGSETILTEFLHLAETPVDGGRRSIESGGWKLIHVLRTGNYELFHRASDPGETLDRITDREADEAYSSLRDLLATIPSPLLEGPAPDLADLPESAREKLRGLGYLTDD